MDRNPNFLFLYQSFVAIWILIYNIHSFCHNLGAFLF